MIKLINNQNTQINNLKIFLKSHRELNREPHWANVSSCQSCAPLCHNARISETKERNPGENAEQGDRDKAQKRKHAQCFEGRAHPWDISLI